MPDNLIDDSTDPTGTEQANANVSADLHADKKTEEIIMHELQRNFITCHSMTEQSP